MSNNSHFISMTKDGLAKAKEELKHAKSVERPKAIEAVAVARAHGDLTENAEYDAAKEHQAQLEGRIADLENQIRRAHVVEISSTDEIVFGAHVKVKEIGSSDEEEYHLVGAGESNPAQGKISTASPIGKALLNRKKGDTVEIEIPNGSIKMKILDFWY